MDSTLRIRDLRALANAFSVDPADASTPEPLAWAMVRLRTFLGRGPAEGLPVIPHTFDLVSIPDSEIERVRAWTVGPSPAGVPVIDVGAMTNDRAPAASAIPDTISLDLAQRAVACKAWRWMPGMAVVGAAIDGPARVVAESDGQPVVFDSYDDWAGVIDRTLGVLPDLADPATLGCLLALVRKAWDAEAWFQPIPSRYVKFEGWMVGVYGRAIVSRELTLAEALVAALEAAPWETVA